MNDNLVTSPANMADA